MQHRGRVFRWVWVAALAAALWLSSLLFKGVPERPASPPNPVRQALRLCNDPILRNQPAQSAAACELVAAAEPDEPRQPGAYVRALTVLGHLHDVHMALATYERGDFVLLRRSQRKPLTKTAPSPPEEHLLGLARALSALQASPGPEGGGPDLYQAVLQQLGESPSATQLSNLSLFFLQDPRSFELSRVLALQAFDRGLRTGGSRSRMEARMLANLGLILAMGGYEDRALRQYELALKIYRSWPEDPDVPILLNNMALLQARCADPDGADTLYRQASALVEKQDIEGRTLRSLILMNQAAQAVARGRLVDAVPVLEQVASLQESLLRASRSEQRIQAVLIQQESVQQFIYGLLLRPGPVPERLAQLALRLSLTFKGSTAEASARRAAPDDPELRALQTAWDSLHAEREHLLFSGARESDAAQRSARRQELDLRIQKLEHELSVASRTLAPDWPQLEDITESVAVKLPAGSALLEVIVVVPYVLDEEARGASAGRWGQAHYVALLLTPDRDVTVHMLGTEEEIDRRVAELLLRLQDPSSDPLPAAHALHQQVMQPLMQRLHRVSRIYLSLDGALNAVPIAALHDGAQYLLHRFKLSYLSSGRELLRTPDATSKGPALILADPVPLMPAAADGAAGSIYSQLGGLPRLPGARREAERLAGLLSRATVLLGAEASESALKRAGAPPILHIATHGAFLEGALRIQASARGLRPLTGPLQGQDVDRVLGRGAEEPLIRSALVLSRGLPDKTPVDEDGLVTAEEVRALNLRGTELVVLATCESGRGTASAGQGIYGLRRAFFAAGAQTLVVSLWRIADGETSELMARYYQKLVKERRPRARALQEAEQELQRRRPHPYYWAPFVAIGQDAPLSLSSR